MHLLILLLMLREPGVARPSSWFKSTDCLNGLLIAVITASLVMRSSIGMLIRAIFLRSCCPLGGWISSWSRRVCSLRLLGTNPILLWLLRQNKVLLCLTARIFYSLRRNLLKVLLARIALVSVLLTGLLRYVLDLKLTDLLSLIHVHWLLLMNLFITSLEVRHIRLRDLLRLRILGLNTDLLSSGHRILLRSIKIFRLRWLLM